MEWGTAVGVVVLDDQILYLLGVDEGSGERVALGLDVVVVLEAVGSEQLLHLLMGAGRNLVDHRPGEGHLRLVLQIVEEGGGNQFLLGPALGIGHDAGLHAVAVVRAVVHRLDGERQFAGEEPLEEQARDLSHGEDGLQPALQVGLVVGVALLGDGEGNHLQRGLAEDVDQALPVGELRVGLQRLGDAGDDFLADGAVGAERHAEREVVVGRIGLVDDFEVERLGHDDASVVLARVQGVVEDGSGEGAEDVASAEVHPRGLIMCLATNVLDIEFRKLIAFRFPLCGI